MRFSILVVLAACGSKPPPRPVAEPAKKLDPGVVKALADGGLAKVQAGDVAQSSTTQHGVVRLAPFHHSSRNTGEICSASICAAAPVL